MWQHGRPRTLQSAPACSCSCLQLHFPLGELGSAGSHLCRLICSQECSAEYSVRASQSNGKSPMHPQCQWGPHCVFDWPLATALSRTRAHPAHHRLSRQANFCLFDHRRVLSTHRSIVGWCFSPPSGVRPRPRTLCAGVLDPPFGRSLGGWNVCGNFKTTSC